MALKLVNPLSYPLAVLAGAIALFLGVRVAKLPSPLMLPLAGAIATGGAILLKAREPESLGLENPALERELQSVRQQATVLATQAAALQIEATRLLTDAAQMELLGLVQYACDRTKELPAKIDQLTRRLHGAGSLLSVDDLQKQLREVQGRMSSSSGVGKEQLQQLTDSLQRNIQLAREGQDARQAQVVSLSTLILDSAEVLQTLQNKLRTANLLDADQAGELRSLSEALNASQETVDLLIHRSS